MTLFAIGTVLAVCGLLAYALCKAAADSDELAERQHQAQERAAADQLYERRRIQGAPRRPPIR